MLYILVKIKKSIKRKLIEYQLKKLHVNNSFRLNDDGSIDLFGDVNIANQGLTEIPVKINEVQGFFDCSNNKLTNLINMPKAVMRHFYCRDNNLVSLKGCPELIGGSLYAEGNNITSLDFLPKQIKNSIHLQSNPVRVLDGIKGLPLKTSSSFYIHMSNKSFSKEDIEFYLNNLEKIQLKDELRNSLESKGNIIKNNKVKI